MTRFLEKKHTALPITVLPSINVLSVDILPSKYLSNIHQPAADGPTHDKDQTQLVLDQPKPAAVDNPEPPNTEPPDDDVLTKEDFYQIMENFKKESSDLFKQKLTNLFS